MAGLAITHVLREVDVRVVVNGTTVADDGVAVLQVHAIVNLVDHAFHVHGATPFLVGRIGVDRGGVVTGHAVFDVEAGFAMKLEVVMAGIAGSVVHDQARERRRAASRYEIVGRVVGRDAFGDDTIGANFEAESMRLVFVEGRTGRVISQVVRKRVGIGTVTVVGERAVLRRFVACLYIGRIGAPVGHVGLPLARAPRCRCGRELREHETHRAGRQSLEAESEVVAEAQCDLRRAAAGRNRNGLDLNIDLVG